MEINKYINMMIKSAKAAGIEKTNFEANVLIVNDKIVVTNQPTANKVKYTYVREEE